MLSEINTGLFEKALILAWLLLGPRLSDLRHGDSHLIDIRRRLADETHEPSNMNGDPIVASRESPVDPDCAAFGRETYKSAACGAPPLTGRPAVLSLLRRESIATRGLP
jgi:hypothetical protein